MSKVYGTLPDAVLPAPAVPSGLVAGDISAWYVTLTWDTATDATSWVVYRDGVLIGTPETATYLDTGRTPSTLYSYQVQAVGPSGSSALTAGLSITTSANTAPALAVPNQTLSTGQNFALDLAQLADDPDNQPLVFTVLSGAVPGLAVVGGVYTGTPSTVGTYTPVFDVYDGYAHAQASASFVVADSDVTAPSIPANVAATVTGSTVHLTWDESTDASGISAYRVRRNNSLRASTLPNELFYDDVGVPDGSWTYHIRAVDASANLNTSANSLGVTVQVSTVPLTPDVPAGFTISQPSATALDLSWAPGPNGAAPTDYDLDYSTVSSAGPWTPIPFTGTGTTYQHTGLVQGTWYYRVRANAGALSSGYAPAQYTITAPTGNARFTIPTNTAARTFTGGNFPLTAGGTATPVAGDIIELAAGTHGPLVFQGIKGTASKRITIRGPQSGTTKARIRRAAAANGGFIFHLVDSSYVTIDGENPSIGTQGAKGWKCGIAVMYASSGSDAPTDYIKYSNVAGSATRTLCHRITLRFVEVDGNWPTNPGTGGSGYGLRPHQVNINRYEAPYAGTATQDPYYIEGDIFEYNYFHNLPKAAMYLGGNWTETTASGNFSPPPCRGMIVRHNWLENCGGGIHAKAWWLDGSDGTRNAVHDNYIKNCGQYHNTPNTEESIGVLACTADVYNNVVLDNAWPNTEVHDTTRPDPHAFRVNTNNGPIVGTAVAGGYGIIGTLTVNIFNNLVTRAGTSLPNPSGNGMQISRDAAANAIGYEAHVYNNTVYGCADNGISMANVYAGSFIKNNICVANGAAQISPAASTGTITVSNNVTTGGAGLFVNPTQGVDNFRLNAATSPAATGVAGTDYSTADIGTPPHGTTYTTRGVGADNPDCGAYEK